MEAGVQRSVAHRPSGEPGCAPVSDAVGPLLISSGPQCCPWIRVWTRRSSTALGPGLAEAQVAQDWSCRAPCPCQPLGWSPSLTQARILLWIPPSGVRWGGLSLIRVCVQVAWWAGYKNGCLGDCDLIDWGQHPASLVSLDPQGAVMHNQAENYWGSSASSFYRQKAEVQRREGPTYVLRLTVELCFKPGSPGCLVQNVLNLFLTLYRNESLSLVRQIIICKADSHILSPWVHKIILCIFSLQLMAEKTDAQRS